MDPIFEPDGVTWQHVSPRLITARFISAAIVIVPLVAAAIVLALVLSVPWLYGAAGVLLALAAWLAWLIPRQVRAIAYAEREDDLLIRHGVMFRELVVVPYGRMQYVDVNFGPLERALSVASLQLHTASATTDASLSGLDPDEAARLRDRLASRGEARLAGL